MIPNFSEHSTLHLIGDRDYIHGATLFDTFCKALQKATSDHQGSILVKKFLVNESITVDGIIRVFKLSELKIGGGNKRALAEMTCILNGQSYYIGLFDEGLETVSARWDSLEKDYVADTQSGNLFEGTCRLKDVESPAILIQAVVEANKQIILLSLPKQNKEEPYKLKFVYCLEYVNLSELPASEGQVFIRNLGTRIHNDYCYILNSLRFELDHYVTTFQICFGSQDIFDLHLTK